MSYTKTAIWELIYPLVLSIGASLAVFFFSKDYCLDFRGLVEVSLNVFGILIGFLITVLTIINSIENSYTRALINGGSYHLLITYLKQAIWGCFFSIVVGVSHVFFFTTVVELVMNLLNTLFVFSFVFALTTSYRFIKIFLRLSLKKK